MRSLSSKSPVCVAMFQLLKENAGCKVRKLESYITSARYGNMTKQETHQLIYLRLLPFQDNRLEEQIKFLQIHTYIYIYIYIYLPLAPMQEGLVVAFLDEKFKISFQPSSAVP